MPAARQPLAGIRLLFRLVPLFLLLTMLAASAALSPPPVAAEAELARVTPADGELLTRWPRGIAVSFSEQLDQEASTMRLVDMHGEEIPDTSFDFGPDGATMSITPPSGLDHGTYTIIWEAHSAEDDTVTPGYSSFTVGTAADGAVVTIPSSSGPPGGPPQWLETLSRGVALAGIAALVAIWPIWTLVIRPAAAGAWRLADPLVHRVNSFTIGAVIVALLGSLFQIVVQAQNLIGGTALDKVMNTIGNSGAGYAWIARMVLIVLLAIVLAVAAWWFVGRRTIGLVLAWLLSLGIPLTLSFTGHAWDEPVGRAATVANDYVHTTAALIWGGGVVVLLVVLLPVLRGATGEVRRRLLTTALWRFGALSLVTWLLMAISGAYSAWLNVGNMTAMTTTDYGRSTMVKLVAVAITLVQAAVVLLVVRRRIARGDAAWSARLSWVLGLQAVLVVVVLFATGQMASQPPARNIVMEQANQVSIPITFADRPSTLLIAPGATGVNHIRLEVPGAYLPNETEAWMTVSMPDNEEIGIKDVLLSRVSGNNFEHHGTEFSLTGTWEIGVSLEEPGFPPLSMEIVQDFGTETPEHDLPGIPWRFDPWGGVGAVLLFLVAIGGIITAAYAGKTPLRKEAGGLGATALALGIVILLQARYDPIIAIGGNQGEINENDLVMVERGELVYEDACMSCHGPELRGDGPLADTMDPPPADFSAPHTYVHSDEDLIYWIKNGKQGTGMPGFDATLTDQEIRDVLAFIKNRQQDMGEDSSAVSAETCVVAEMSFADVVGSFNHSIHPDVLRGTPLVEAIDSDVDGDTQNDVLFTVEQLVACTNSGNTLRRLPLFTDMQMKDMFPMGMDARLTQLTTGAMEPLPEDQQVGLQDVQSIRWLADGRIAADVIFTDPASVGISLDDERPVITQATLVFLWNEDAGAWLIDEIR